jgi:hypothetical protein
VSGGGGGGATLPLGTPTQHRPPPASLQACVPATGTVNLVRPSVAGMIGGLISVGRGWVDGRRGAVVQGVPLPDGDH